MNHQEAKNLNRFWIKLTRIFQSLSICYKCIRWPLNYARRQYPTGLGYGQLTNETVVCKILYPSIGSQILTIPFNRITNIDQMQVFLFVREKTQVGFLLYLVH